MQVHLDFYAMANTSIYFDCRKLRKDGKCPLKLVITHKGDTAYLNLNVYLLKEQWDARNFKVVNHPQKQFTNVYIARRRAEVETFILKLVESGDISRLTAQDIKNKFVESESPDAGSKRMKFEARFIAFMNKKNESTKALYKFTLNKIQKFCPNISQLDYEDINQKWLEEFDAFLAKTGPSKNYRNIQLRNIRAVFNAAIDAEDTTFYPFRKFKIRPVPTRKRALSVTSLRKLFDYPVDQYAEIYRDMFKLIFMLMGINAVDLHRLESITPDNRIEYTRAKTHRLYSILVEPEAAELINKYQGTKGLLCISDRWSNHKNFIHQMNKALQNIGVTRKGLGGKKQDDGLFSGISSYWARHSWATIAADLDIPKETIAAALGHGSNTVTDIYIDFNQKKVDEANRRVLDWVLYGKR